MRQAPNPSDDAVEFVERCARQILRHYAQGDSIDDREHLAISGQMAARLEQELKKLALPKWVGPGKQYLDCLVVAFEIAREHRNHLVHGIYEAVGARAEHESVRPSSSPRSPREDVLKCLHSSSSAK